jgi:hypothetical protein
MTNNLDLRMARHEATQGWWWQVVGPPTVRWYRSREAAANAERAAIWRDRPIHNDTYNRDNPHRVPVHRPHRSGEGIRL